MLPGWVEPYIGLPHVMGGRSKDGCDCWGLAWIVLAEVFGKEPPSYEGVTWNKGDAGAARAQVGAIVNQAAHHHFREIEPGKEEPGDVIVLRIAGNPLHVGIVAGGCWMLHSAEDADSAGERYDGMVWKHRVVGFWRFRGGAGEEIARTD
jgi:cell wall-associated NlpC family hydrolase